MPKKKSGSKAASGSTTKGGKEKTTKKGADLKHKYDWKMEDDVIRFYREEAISAWKCFLAASLERYIFALVIKSLSKEFDIATEVVQISTSFGLTEEQKTELGTILGDERDTFYMSMEEEETQAAKRFIYGMQAIDSGQPATSLPLIDPKASLQHFLNLVAEGRLPTQPNPPEDDDLNLSFASSTFSEDSSSFLTARSTLDSASPRDTSTSISVSQEETTRVNHCVCNIDSTGHLQVEKQTPEVDPRGTRTDVKCVEDVNLLKTEDLKVDIHQQLHVKETTNPPEVVTEKVPKKKRQKSGTTGSLKERKVQTENKAAERVAGDEQDLKRAKVNQSCLENKDDVTTKEGVELNQSSGSRKNKRRKSDTKEKMEQQAHLTLGASKLEVDEDLQCKSSEMAKSRETSAKEKQSTKERTELDKSSVAEKLVPNSSQAVVSADRKLSLSTNITEQGDTDDNIEDNDELFALQFARVQGTHGSLAANSKKQSDLRLEEKMTNHESTRAGKRVSNWATGGKTVNNNRVILPVTQSACNGAATHPEPCGNQQCPARLHFHKRKTSICTIWQAGRCKFYEAADCWYAHGSSDLKQLPKLEICQKHQYGKCRLPASQCVYAHSAEELREDNSLLNVSQSLSKGSNGGQRHTKVEKKSENTKQRTGAECSICFQDLLMADRLKLDCGHNDFHWKCVTQWTDRNATCPMCRKDLLSKT